ncbi:hypothetical protein SMICM304S_01605 [Streptomyces microflavus]
MPFELTHDDPHNSTRGRGVDPAKSELLRIVVDEGVCAPDPRGTLPWPGAYVHPTSVCLDLAVRRRAFPRAFKAKGPFDTAGTHAVRRAGDTVEKVNGTGPRAVRYLASWK